MYIPSLEQVQTLAKTYNLIPITREVMADTETPIRLFHHVYDEDYAFLLESVEGGAKWARYSFIGTSPFMTVSVKNGRFRIDLNGKTTVVDEKPLQMLRSLLSHYTSPSLPELPRFTGGAVGFFGYDLLQYYEDLPAHRHQDLNMNDLQFMFCDQIVAFDHMKQSLKVIANLHVPESATETQIAEAYRKTCQQIEKLIERINHPLAFPIMKGGKQAQSEVELGEFQSNMTKAQFIESVERAQQYIHAGEVSQVVLSQRFEMETDVSPLHVYRILRTMNPSPYMYYLKMHEEVIVGTSPELLVRVEGDQVETRPIAGTRPRGRTPEDDQALERELLADEKERAEHDMLVEMGRSDLEQVCTKDSIHCNAYMEIERYSHVMHLVSNLAGKLKNNKDFYDALITCMPAGTVSGAPKLRAMEIIAELEREARGAYAGAIGYLGFSGNLDTCITIRTIIFKEGRAYVQAGAGIVAESVAEKEYEETLNKAKALLSSIQIATTTFSNKNTAGNIPNQDY